MSLILEALKKLEREKGTTQRGFTVLAATPWPSRRGIPLTAVLAGGLLVAGGVAVGLALRPRAAAPPTAERAAVPSSQPSAEQPLTSERAAVPTIPAPLDKAYPRSTPLPVRPVAAGPVATPPPAAVAAPSPAAPPAESLRLQAISERDGHPVAVLNERVVEEGDEFDGIRVIRIGRGEVEVDVRGRRRILTF